MSEMESCDRIINTKIELKPLNIQSNNIGWTKWIGNLMEVR